MQKIPTIFLRDDKNMSHVTQEINPDAAWVLEEPAVATVKKDGTNIRVHVVKDGLISKCVGVDKRRNPSKKEKQAAEKAGEPAPEPTYVWAEPDAPADKHIFAAVDAEDFSGWPPGAWPCEALGPKIQGGIESDTPELYPFSFRPQEVPDSPLNTVLPPDRLWEMLKAYLEVHPIEGIVWHGINGKMAKVKAKDLGLPWPPERKG